MYLVCRGTRTGGTKDKGAGDPDLIKFTYSKSPELQNKHHFAEINGQISTDLLKMDVDCRGLPKNWALWCRMLSYVAAGGAFYKGLKIYVWNR